jgi:hypothetical protein
MFGCFLPDSCRRAPALPQAWICQKHESSLMGDIILEQMYPATQCRSGWREAGKEDGEFESSGHRTCISWFSLKSFRCNNVPLPSSGTNPICQCRNVNVLKKEHISSKSSQLYSLFLFLSKVTFVQDGLKSTEICFHSSIPTQCVSRNRRRTQIPKW